MAQPTAWRVTDGTDGEVQIFPNALIGEVPDVRPGKEITLTYAFIEGRLGVNTAGGQYGANTQAVEGTRYATLDASDAGALYGATTTVPGVESYSRLKRYPTTGTVAVGTALDGEPYYRETLPSDAEITSRVLQFEPFADLDGITGLWGLVSGYEDVSANVPAFYELELDVYVLAESGDYSARSDVIAEYEATP